MSEAAFIPSVSTPHRRGFPVWPLVIGVLISSALAGLLASAVYKAREAARAAQCTCNLCSIKLALANYHDAYGSFPPAFVADASGRPMHSWRVLILPYLYQPLFDAYKMDEPWDGPNNRKLIDQRPSIYHCPSRKPNAGLTSYVAITGPGTAFPGAKPTRLGDIHDGPGGTLLVAEVSNVDIAWTEPRDLDVRTMSWRVDDPSKPGLSSPHDVGPAVIFADMTYRRLGTYHPPEEIQAMTTIHGGEAVAPEKAH